MRRKILTLKVTQDCIDRAGRACHNCPVALSALRAGLVKPRVYSVITGNIIGGHAHDRVNYSGVEKAEHQRILDFIRAYDGGEKITPTTFRIKVA